MLKLKTNFENWNRLSQKISNNDVIILQHPYEGIHIAGNAISYLKRTKQIVFILFIHDLLSLRQNIENKSSSFHNDSNSNEEIRIAKLCDHVVAHNDAMKNYLIDQGIEENKIVCLEIFDYLHECYLPEKRVKEKSVVVAGNLLRGKCEYLYKLCAMDNRAYKLHLFGPNYEENMSAKDVIYHGQCSPDELPKRLEGSFGLVWDGTEIDRCAGNAGEYIRYNDPHKCSLFLASNMPVIIWKEAALAGFVERNGLGLTVNSLDEIGGKIDNLTDKEYEKMVENVKKVGENLRDGFYFRQALDKIIDVHQSS